ncbi:DUF624 domain-containing protein [Vagococcus sp. BWB3-3]|uniref:DUF624 domain-containing protein n=1 Tax=Vagococcus allomyrinae TaxID=2794353 RepID=A0A940PIE4_9ENTE|nr:DUF624 domain-containing protein [Vagococcus allomyrinae]MBP1044151.1 DUF624 domain-containing protein [Vagococcus allomyrinae]
MGEKLYHWSVVLTRLVYLNLLWLLFTLLGGIILGIMPATVALFAVLRQEIKAEGETTKVGSTFIDYFRKEFVKSNLLGIGLILLGVLLYLNYQLTTISTGYLMSGLHYLSIVLLCLFIMLLVFFFPVYVHFQLPLSKVLLQPLLLIFFSPFEVCKVIVILTATYYLFHWIPGLLPLIYMSLPAALIMLTLHRRFLRLPIYGEKNSSIPE